MQTPSLPKDVAALIAIDRYLTALEQMLKIDARGIGSTAEIVEVLEIIASRISAISEEVESFTCATV